MENINRRQLITRLIQTTGISRDEAEKIADETLGAVNRKIKPKEIPYSHAFKWKGEDWQDV